MLYFFAFKKTTVTILLHFLLEIYGNYKTRINYQF